ncbi:MAG: PH domain-containing protein [Bacteroidia bacterium]
MTTPAEIIHEAAFNTKFRTYIFFIVLFYLFMSVIGWIVIPFWICGLGQWLSGKYFNTLMCRLTSKQLLFSKGILFRIEKTIPLENIQDLSFVGGPILRGLGLTFIRVETAGGGGGHGNQSMMSIPGVIGAEELKTLILAQREVVIREKHGPVLQGSATNDVELLQEIRDELKGLREDLNRIAAEKK